MKRLVARLRLGDDKGMTMIEVLVATAIGVGLLAVVSSLMISALRSQPRISNKTADIGTARFVLDRMTKELRNGIAVNEANPSSVSFQAYVRRTACGGTTAPAPAAPSIRCQVTLTCVAATKTCSRREAAPGQVGQGTATTVFTGLSNGTSVFTYSPSAASPTYVKVSLILPDPSGGRDDLSISDGATLRNAVLEG